jgi:hypothetical protein
MIRTPLVQTLARNARAESPPAVLSVAGKVLLGTFALCSILSGCGPADTLTASTTSAKAAADAAKQAKEQKEQIESQIRTMQQTEQKRVEQISEQADHASQ